ncbi:helix-turn-helix transcriptional regulator [Escherichia coli]|nr:helix-turn-helix transcriptional regulator [Escherichia coli]
MVNLLNLKPIHCRIIYASNCSLIINNKKERFFVDKGGVVFLRKYTNVIIKINKHDDRYPPYDFVEFKSQDVDNLLKIMAPMYSPHKRITGNTIDKDNGILLINNNGISLSLFSEMKKPMNDRLKAYMIAYFLSESNEVENIYLSLVRSATVHFRDKVKQLIENDIAMKWQLSLIAEEFNVSEITIRKKLEMEKTSFYQILLDVRMQTAARLILKNEHQINKVATMVGISSPSYFIRVFHSYYGMTPKNFYFYYKGRRGKI